MESVHSAGRSRQYWCSGQGSSLPSLNSLGEKSPMQVSCRAPSVIDGHLQRAVPPHLLHGRVNCFLKMPFSLR